MQQTGECLTEKCHTQKSRISLPTLTHSPCPPPPLPQCTEVWSSGQCPITGSSLETERKKWNLFVSPYWEHRQELSHHLDTRLKASRSSGHYDTWDLRQDCGPVDAWVKRWWVEEYNRISKTLKRSRSETQEIKTFRSSCVYGKIEWGVGRSTHIKPGETHPRKGLRGSWAFILNCVHTLKQNSIDSIAA